MKWLFAVVVALVVFGGLTPWLRKLGFGRLPGDVSFERDGKRYELPIGSTLFLSLLASLVFWMLR